MKGSFPNFTFAQLLGAIIGALYPALTLLGIDLDAEQRGALDNLFIIGLGLFGADAAIRIGRNVGTSHTGNADGVAYPEVIPADGDDSTITPGT